MLRVKQVVHRRQRDVLVAAAVAGDEVRVEQVAVVRARRLTARDGAEVADQSVSNSGQTRVRHRVMRDVVEELMIGVQRRGGDVDTEAAVCRRIALEERGRGGGPDHELRESVRAGLEVAVLIGQHQWHVEDVRIDQMDPELGRRLRLHLAPITDVADVVAGDSGAARRAEAAVEHFAVRDRHRGRSGHRVLPQEHLVRRM